ncbi:MAG TPA: PIN domain-containing protein [Chloroflexia bacterium]|nr:PIN domain-containing protein [Chloroflexia bacterium]
MTARFFVDTNVLIYSYSLSEPDKQHTALEVLKYIRTKNSGAISTQVLGEFFVTATRKLTPPLTVDEAYQQVSYFITAWTVIEMTTPLLLEALRGVRNYQLNYWDAQIWAAARHNRIQTVITEDFNTGATIEGVTFINPFSQGFKLAEVLG